jgi:hypothetical protein
MMTLKVWHAEKGSGEPPLGLCLVDAGWKRARMVRFPRLVRRLLGLIGVT